MQIQWWINKWVWFWFCYSPNKWSFDHLKQLTFTLSLFSSNSLYLYRTVQSWYFLHNILICENVQGTDLLTLFSVSPGECFQSPELTSQCLRFKVLCYYLLLNIPSCQDSYININTHTDIHPFISLVCHI